MEEYGVLISTENNEFVYQYHTWEDRIMHIQEMKYQGYSLIDIKGDKIDSYFAKFVK